MYWIHGVTLSRRDGGYHCRYCGASLIPPVNEPDFILPDPDAVHGTVDHLTPIARGGHNGTGNLGLACRTCNYWHVECLICEREGFLYIEEE